MGSRNRPKIDQNPIPDSDVSFLLLPWSPTTAQGAKMVPQGAKMQAPGLPSDMFWAPKMSESVSKFTIMPKKCELETNIQEPASQHTFQQRKNDQEANIQKPAARGPAAVGEAHKISLDVHAHPQISMDIHGCLRKSMDVHKCAWTSLDIFGFPLMTMIFMGLLIV